MVNKNVCVNRMRICNTVGQCCYRVYSQAVRKQVKVVSTKMCVNRMVRWLAGNMGRYAGEGKPNSLKEM
jgi:hypothetical protein